MMFTALWRKLYAKQAGVYPLRSGLGCLLATVAGGVFCVVVLLAAGETPIWHPGPHADALMASHGVAKIEAAFARLLRDAGVADARTLFAATVKLDRDTLEATMQHHTALARKLLHDGGYAEVGLKPDIAARLQAAHPRKAQQRPVVYMQVPRGPGGVEYQFFFGPWPAGGCCGEATLPFRARADLPLYIVWLGPNGVLDRSAGDDVANFIR
jgi:hypothetical protein